LKATVPDTGRIALKKSTTIAGLLFVILLTACASGGNGTGSGKGGGSGKAPAMDGLSLQEAIERSAERIAEDLKAGSRIALIAFESPNDRISEHILEELAGALFDRGVEVADRRNLEHVTGELDFQMSGYVSDESALSIGKFLGARMVITGQLRYLGDAYRFQVNAVNTEDATRGSVIRIDVRNDRAMQNLMATK